MCSLWVKRQDLLQGWPCYPYDSQGQVKAAKLEVRQVMQEAVQDPKRNDVPWQQQM